MNFTRTIDATSEPVTLDEAKKQLRVEDHYENEEIEALITVARQQLEKYAEISIKEQTWVGKFNKFPQTILLPFGPVIQVSSVVYEKDGEQTLTPDSYQVDKDSKVGRVVADSSFPSTDDVLNAVTVTYTAGFSEVPDQIKHAVKAQVAFLYENRGDGTTGGLSELAKILIQNYKVYQSAWQQEV